MDFRDSRVQFNFNWELFSFKGQQQFTYNGDRTKDEIVKFALRLNGPPVQEVTKMESFDTLRKDRDLYFLYVGERASPLWVKPMFNDYPILLIINLFIFTKKPFSKKYNVVHKPMYINNVSFFLIAGPLSSSSGCISTSRILLSVASKRHR